MNTQQIDAQVLAALQAEAENVTKGMAAAAKESPQKDLFDMSKCRRAGSFSLWSRDLNNGFRQDSPVAVSEQHLCPAFMINCKMTF